MAKATGSESKPSSSGKKRLPTAQGEPTKGQTYLIDYAKTLPADIVSAWFDGDYLLGDKNSNQVKYIGYCLALLGTYKYFTLEQVDKDHVRVAHFGICRIELVHQELEFRGMRLYTNPLTWSPSQEADRVFLWSSDFSKIWDSGARQHLLFAYSMRSEDPDIETKSSLERAGLPALLDIVKSHAAKIQDPDSDFVARLQQIDVPRTLMEIIEGVLSDPRWGLLATGTQPDRSLQRLFAFLKFEDLERIMLRMPLVAEYRALAPLRVSGSAAWFRASR